MQAFIVKVEELFIFFVNLCINCFSYSKSILGASFPNQAVVFVQVERLDIGLIVNILLNSLKPGWEVS